MAGSVATFLAQNFASAFLPRDRFGYSSRGLWTMARHARHRWLDRPFHLGLLTGGLRLRNITELHAFWLNEKLESFRVSIDPAPRTADIFWVFSQDPLEGDRRSRIGATLAAMRPGTPVINPPSVFDAYHDPDIFQRLEEAGISVPRRDFGAGDIGKPVILKPVGKQSKTIGPLPWAGPVAGMRAFEFLETRGADGLYKRYRAFYVLGRLFAGSRQESTEPIVRAHSRSGDNSWRLTDVEAKDVRRAARVTGLDFFSADFLRLADGSRSVLTDINSFPMMKERDLRPGHYGHLHDFHVLRPADGDTSAWAWLEAALRDRVARR